VSALQQTTVVVDPVPGAYPPHLPGQPDLVQLLTPEGERVEHPDYSLDISNEELRGLYRDLALVRRWDVEATALQRQGELGIWASLLGQEAAQVGAGRALAADDMAFPTYREHGVAWTRGVDPLDVMSLFRGVDMGGWDPVATGFNLYTVVIGAQCLHATGYAMGLQRDGAESATLAFLGDGATSQGEVNEALIWASSFAAPVVFFCQNNQYAISVPIERQSRAPLFHRAAGFGFPGVRVDGNDVLAVLAVTRAALAAAREGQGPTFIEAFTYRMGAHTSSDDPTRYRLASELEEWKLRDPIARLKAHLSRSGIADHDFFTAVDAEGDELAARLRKGTLEMPDPAGTEIFDHVYVEQTPPLAAQRAEFVAYHESFEGEGH
jgi:2-oxoisovalerate dehydrogenase E1 component alpha subunit